MTYARLQRQVRIASLTCAFVLTPFADTAAQQVSAARAFDLQPAAVRHAAAPAPAAEAASVMRIDNPAVRGGLVGALVGGAVAAIATFAVIESSDRDFGIDGIYYSIFVPIGMAAGAVVGAVIGASR